MSAALVCTIVWQGVLLCVLVCASLMSFSEVLSLNTTGQALCGLDMSVHKVTVNWSCRLTQTHCIVSCFHLALKQHCLGMLQ